MLLGFFSSIIPYLTIGIFYVLYFFFGVGGNSVAMQDSDAENFKQTSELITIHRVDINLSHPSFVFTFREDDGHITIKKPYIEIPLKNNILCVNDVRDVFDLTQYLRPPPYCM